MSAVKVNRTLECEGLACPLPVVRTKKAIEELHTGEVLEVRATDRGSLSDLQSWAKRTGHQYIGLKEEGEVLCHYIRKADPSEVKAEIRYPLTITMEELLSRRQAGEPIHIIDVREPAEYAFGHLSGAVSIPAGELEQRLQELNPARSYAVVCRTGNRSDAACQLLAAQGFAHVHNVLPGMLGWTGEQEKG